jgi:uncharacterized protein YjbI with pentapeptide repeats
VISPANLRAKWPPSKLFATRQSPEQTHEASLDGKVAIVSSLLAFSLAVAAPAYAVSGGGLDFANLDISGQDFSNGNYKGKDFTQGA